MRKVRGTLKASIRLRLMAFTPLSIFLKPASKIKFCPSCGGKVAQRLPDDGDNRIRAVCTVCNTVHYENPLLVVGTLPYTADGRVLLCQRAIEPRKGYWTLPAGFMELGETVSEGALRETQEEAGADIVLGDFFAMLSVAHVAQVHIFYLAALQSETFAPGEAETLEARLFSEDEIPWGEIAFRTVEKTLKNFFVDRRKGAFGLHTEDIL